MSIIFAGYREIDGQRSVCRLGVLKNLRNCHTLAGRLTIHMRIWVVIALSKSRGMYINQRVTTATNNRRGTPTRLRVSQECDATKRVFQFLSLQ